MDVITKNFKTLGGALIIICCLLPFITVGWGGFSASANGFSLFSSNILGLLAILLILGGAGALIYVGLTKDMTLMPKFTLSYVAKLAALGGGVLALICILTTPLAGIGFGLILEIVVAIAIFFEEKVLAALNKK